MNEVTEVCPECGYEVTLKWDVEKDGYKAFCPYCGARLMLCDMCMHRINGVCCCDCDYNAQTDTCRFNGGHEDNTNEFTYKVEGYVTVTAVNQNEADVAVHSMEFGTMDVFDVQLTDIQ